MCEKCVEDGTISEEAWKRLQAGGVLSLGSLLNDPEEEAASIMNGNVSGILAQYRERMEGVTPELMESLNTARGRKAFADTFAGWLMYTASPTAIALTLALVVARYDDVLRQWADLYVDKGGDLDTFMTEEAGQAITELRQAHEPGTGMYL